MKGEVLSLPVAWTALTVGFDGGLGLLWTVGTCLDCFDGRLWQSAVMVGFDGRLWWSTLTVGFDGGL